MSNAKSSVRVFALVCILSLSFSTLADDLALSETLPKQGDSTAAVNLALSYAKSKDFTKTFDLFAQAADQGNAEAQYNLGLMYDSGEGLTQDYAKAAKWYEKAANQGDNSAQNNLGIMYNKGDGVSKDYGRAIEWYRKSADQNNANAQYNLGTIYESGEGVPQDFNEALQWYKKAAAQNQPQAQYRLGKLYSEGKVSINLVHKPSTSTGKPVPSMSN